MAVFFFLRFACCFKAVSVRSVRFGRRLCLPEVVVVVVAGEEVLLLAFTAGDEEETALGGTGSTTLVATEDAGPKMTVSC